MALKSSGKWLPGLDRAYRIKYKVHLCQSDIRTKVRGYKQTHTHMCVPLTMQCQSQIYIFFQFHLAHRPNDAEFASKVRQKWSGRPCGACTRCWPVVGKMTSDDNDRQDKLDRFATSHGQVGCILGAKGPRHTARSLSLCEGTNYPRGARSSDSQNDRVTRSRDDNTRRMDHH